MRELKRDLIEQINDCQDFDDEPESFDIDAFTTLRIQSVESRKRCLVILKAVDGQLAQASIKPSVGEPNTHDDRQQLTSMRQLNQDIASSQSSTNLQVAEPSTNEDWRNWAQDGDKNFEPASTPLATKPEAMSMIFELPDSPMGRMASNLDKASVSRNSWSFVTASTSNDPKLVSSSPSAMSPQSGPPASLGLVNHAQLIPKTIVDSRLITNEDFLERRRQSRIDFQKQLRYSVVSTEGDRASTFYPDSEPTISPPITNLYTTPGEGGGSLVGSPVDLSLIHI